MYVEALSTIAIKVKCLILHKCALGPKAATALSFALATADVEEVDISGNPISWARCEFGMWENEDSDLATASNICVLH